MIKKMLLMSLFFFFYLPPLFAISLYGRVDIKTPPVQNESKSENQTAENSSTKKKKINQQYNKIAKIVVSIKKNDKIVASQKVLSDGFYSFDSDQGEYMLIIDFGENSKSISVILMNEPVVINVEIKKIEKKWTITFTN